MLITYNLYFICIRFYLQISFLGIPKHDFVYRDQEIQTGPRKGEIRKTVRLTIPPYQFKRKTKARDIGKKAVFECISCAKNDVKTYAYATKQEDETGEYHELIQWPNDHDCAPSATSHLARIFTERCYKAVESDPTKSIFQIYKDTRAELGKNLEPEEKTSFLYEIPRLHAIKGQLYKHRRKFIPSAPQNFVS